MLVSIVFNRVVDLPLFIFLMSYCTTQTATMSHLASSNAGQARHNQRSSREVMAIGFLAPQHNETPRSQTQYTSSHTAQGSDSRSISAARPQLEALAYGVNVQASLNARPRSFAPSVPLTAYLRQSQPSRPPLHPPSQMSTPSTSPDQGHFDDLDRTPTSRERRDPYSEEMQFFIMFARIVQELDWRRIEDEFEAIFGQRRPRDGLTAVYYRIRTRWGMRQVLKSGPDKCHNDAEIVEARAHELSHHFLRRIGYIQ